MVESRSNFPFRQLTVRKYLTLEVIMNIEYQEVLSYMFAVNKKTRSYILNNFLTIRNGFINAGVITYQLKTNEFNHFY
jgi:hypothetical protein